MSDLSCDVLVIGAGNAALCAALSALEKTASVIVLERAPREECGGDSRFTAGAIRLAYNGVEDLRRLIPDLTDEECARSDFDSYTQDRVYDDLARVSEYRTDPDLAEILVSRSYNTAAWLHGKGIRFAPIWGRPAFKIGGRFTFWGGLTVEVSGGGRRPDCGAGTARRNDSLPGACAVAAARRRHRCSPHCRAGNRRVPGQRRMAHALSRPRLGPGEGARHPLQHRRRHPHALEADAMPWGNWSGCHAVSWDRNAPGFGDLSVGDGFQKHSYPWASW